ncbi:YbjN domain-containing protein, partial [Acinetobacter baumannii]
ESLHLACAFDLKVPDRRRAEVKELIQLANEQLWLGHFDLWPQEGVVMFRHGLLLAGGAEASGRQCEAQLDAAIEACDRYYQAFQ